MCALWLLVLLYHASAYVQRHDDIKCDNKELYIKLFSIALFCLVLLNKNFCNFL